MEAGLPAISVETRHMHAALSARIDKTDRNDAMGRAQVMGVGLFKSIHVKTPANQEKSPAPDLAQAASAQGLRPRLTTAGQVIRHQSSI